MLTTAIIAFREFLEAFLIAGVFLGISTKLNLHKEREIVFAATLGIIVSLLLATGTYFFGDRARGILTEENAELLESYLLIFSGLFLSYVVFSLHDMLRRQRGAKLIRVHKKLQENTFDLSLFLTIVFLVIREGFEIALFTASTSLFAAFMQNLLGLMLGFVSAIGIGLTTFFAYTKLPIGKIFKGTEYMIILLGAALVQKGITELLEISFNIHLSDVFSFNMHFLPDKESFIGHLLQGLIGIDQEFSGTRLALMVIYMGAMYFLFIQKQSKAQVVAEGLEPPTFSM